MGRRRGGGGGVGGEGEGEGGGGREYKGLGRTVLYSVHTNSTCTNKGGEGGVGAVQPAYSQLVSRLQLVVYRKVFKINTCHLLKGRGQ